MKNVMRVVFALLLVAAIAGAGYWYYRQHATSTASNVAVQVIAVRQGSLSSTVSVVGQLEAVQSASLAFEHLSETTKLVSLAARPGQSVTTGQVLATVDPEPYRQALDQARSDLQAAEKTLAGLNAKATALQLAQADLAVVQARYNSQSAQVALDALLKPNIAGLESALADAQSALTSAQSNVLAQEQDTTYQDEVARLRNAETKPTTEYDRLAAETYIDDWYEDRLELAFNKMRDVQDPRVTYEVQRQVSALQAQITARKARQTLADAQAALDKARAGSNQLELAKGQVTVQEAQVALLAAQDARQKLDAGPDATEVATAQANVDKKRLAVSQAEAALAATSLTAPFDGTVLETQVHAGDQIANGSAILAIANLKTLQVVASVDETTIRRVSAGQAAVVTFDAFPGQQFTGQVDAVPLQGALQGGVTVYDVPVSLTGADQLTLLVGMTANVRLQVASVTDALLVPAMALQQANGAYQVLVVNPADPGGPPQSLAVEVGLSDGAYTQVTGGLVAGDQVVVQLDTTRPNTNAPANPGSPNQAFPAGGSQPLRRTNGR